MPMGRRRAGAAVRGCREKPVHRNVREAARREERGEAAAPHTYVQDHYLLPPLPDAVRPSVHGRPGSAAS